jgi:hypothetical protein
MSSSKNHSHENTISRNALEQVFSSPETQRIEVTWAGLLPRLPSTLKGYICKAVAEHNDIANQSQRDQWKHFILQPLSMLRADSCQSPLVLIADALDECDGDKDVGKFFNSLLRQNCLNQFSCESS